MNYLRNRDEVRVFQLISLRMKLCSQRSPQGSPSCCTAGWLSVCTSPIVSGADDFSTSVRIFGVLPVSIAGKKIVVKRKTISGRLFFTKSNLQC